MRCDGPSPMIESLGHEAVLCRETTESLDFRWLASIPAEEAVSADPREREAWLRERRRATMEQFDVLDSPIYDREWGDIGPVHRDFVLRLVDSCPTGATILDAACGTGKYLDLVLSRGRRVVGFDQSRGMLAKAQEKHPGLPLPLVGLQELAVRRPFEGTMCVDALECLPPEDWPGAIRNLARATVRGGTVYLTVERLRTSSRRPSGGRAHRESPRSRAS